MGVGHCDKSARSGFPAVDAEYPLMKTFLMEEGWACAGDEGVDVPLDALAPYRPSDALGN